MSSIDNLKTLANTKLGFAKANQFLVQMPPLGSSNSGGFGGFLASLFSLPSIPGIIEHEPTSREMNFLCSQVQLPGKQILTTDRRIGMENQKVAYGYAVPEVSMTFYLMNDYGIKRYIDGWMRYILDEYNGIPAYKNEYQHSIKIHQLRRPIAGVSANFGPINIQGDVGGGSVYSCELIQAFPTTMNSIELSNELDGLVQLNVSFSYTRWIDRDVGFEGLFNVNVNI